MSERSQGIGRRRLLASAAGVAAATGLVGAGGTDAYARPGAAAPVARGSGLRAAGVTPFPLSAVRLDDGPFRDNQQRNSAYLAFVDIDRLLHTFRLNVGLSSNATPCGGWEGPDVELRGHSTGHLLSGLALSYAATGDTALRNKGHDLVAGLAECQERSPRAGFNSGYLSAYPESFFDRLESGDGVWAPYYTIHKIMAGLLDQWQLAGSRQARDVVLAQAGWVDDRTGALSRAEMQAVLQTEHGGMNEVFANLHAATGDAHWLDVGERFTHDAVFDPLASNTDRLNGLHANTQIPKMVGAHRLWEEGLPERYRTIADNFWRIVTEHHTYAIGGNSNGEYFHEPDGIASQLSGSCCENCNSYNMLKLTRLLHFTDPDRAEALDYYERTLFNQMLGEQDPDSAHGFNLYYTGLQPGAYKRQPSFMSPEDQYSTDYTNFSCDHGTGMETQAKSGDTVFAHDMHRLLVNLFVPATVTWEDKGITWHQSTAIPDADTTTLTVTAGGAEHELSIRVPAWAEGARATLNGSALPDRPAPGERLTISRNWRTGDRVEVTLPMRISVEATPDDRGVAAVLYGPVVLAGTCGDRSGFPMPRLDTSSVTMTSASPLTFTARADDDWATLLPIARVHHEHYNVYWSID